LSEDLLSEDFWERRKIKPLERPKTKLKPVYDESIFKEKEFAPKWVPRLREEAELEVASEKEELILTTDPTLHDRPDWESPAKEESDLEEFEPETEAAPESVRKAPKPGQPNYVNKQIWVSGIGDPKNPLSQPSPFGTQVCLTATKVRLLVEYGVYAKKPKLVTRDYVHTDKKTGEKTKISREEVITVNYPVAAKNSVGERLKEYESVKHCKVFDKEEEKCILEKANAGKCDLVKQVYACSNTALTDSLIYGMVGKKMQKADMETVKQCTFELENKRKIYRSGITPVGEIARMTPATQKEATGTVVIGGKEYELLVGGGTRLKKPSLKAT
jgi:hypothetical protein